MAKKTKKEIAAERVDELTSRIVTVMFGDHGGFGWNADTKNPAVIELFCDKKLSEAMKLGAVEMLVTKFKTKLLKEAMS